MKNELNQFVDAYSDNANYSLDAKLMSGWYPRRIVAKSAGTSLLELGIGHGRAVSYLAENFERHVIVEGSKEVIDRYYENYNAEKSEIVHEIFESFLTEERFSNISMGFVLEHVENPVRILKRFSQFLKPNGRIFIAVPNATSLHRRIGELAGLMSNIKQLSEADYKLGHKRYYDIAELRANVASANLIECSLEGIFLKPFTTGQIEKLCLQTPVLEAMMKIGIDYPELCNAILMEVKQSKYV